MDSEKRANHLLRTIGMRSTYSGYHYLVTAVALVLEDQNYMKNVTKNLYVVIGEKYGVSACSVEAALRTLITNYWNQNEDKILRHYVKFPIYDKPTSTELISILSDYLRDPVHSAVRK